MALIAEYLDRMMLNTILVPIDDSPEAEQAARAAIWFARDNICKVIVLALARHDDLGGGRPEKLGDIHHKVCLIAEFALSAQVPCETMVLGSMQPVDEILAAATRAHCDLIWFPAYGPTQDDGMLSQKTASALLDRAVIPVMVFPIRAAGL